MVLWFVSGGEWENFHRFVVDAGGDCAVFDVFVYGGGCVYGADRVRVLHIVRLRGGGLFSRITEIRHYGAKEPIRWGHGVNHIHDRCHDIHIHADHRH